MMTDNARSTRGSHPTKPATKSPAVSTQSRPARPIPRSRGGGKKAAAGQTPSPAGTRPVPRWDPEPIFHELVDELHFDPTVVLVR